MESNFIRAYGSVLPLSTCDDLIQIYEKLWVEKEEQLKNLSLCYTESGQKTCGACDCQRLDIMQHHEFNEPFEVVMKGIQVVISQYKKDTNIHPCQWPEKHGFEHLRIKRYYCDEDQQHDFHADVTDMESAKRFLSIICYLNDDFDGGETYFPHFNLQVTPKKGTILLFPCTWSYLHKGNPSTNGHAKYILGSFLNYVGHRKFNRVGDKTLGIEQI
tara:strand:- start:59 stop:706 length:648 start_codon:yes stop_codon:yes gene_type:complete